MKLTIVYPARSHNAYKIASDIFAELAESAAPVVIVLNQCDRGMVLDTALLADFAHVVRVSATKGEVAPLIHTVEGLYLADGIDLREDPIVANARQHAALCNAVASLSRALDALRADVPMDAALIDVELAMRALGEVDGRAVDEAILSDIFANFCVGK